MRPEGQVSGGGGRGELWSSETELRNKFAIEGWGGAPFERVSVSQLGGVRPGAYFPGKFLNSRTLEWLEMHLKLTWCDETYIILTTKNVAIKNVSPQNA